MYKWIKSILGLANTQNSRISEVSFGSYVSEPFNFSNSSVIKKGIAPANTAAMSNSAPAVPELIISDSQTSVLSISTSPSSPSSTTKFQVIHLGPPPQVPVDKKGKPKKGSRKVQLKPGHSLAHWVERLKSGEDMTCGAGSSQNRLITYEEMAAHHCTDDVWMAVRGKVYNITKYLDYHPGGIDILMDEAGKDATKLFDENHRWVNIERLLGPCQVGVLKTLSLAI